MQILPCVCNKNINSAFSSHREEHEHSLIILQRARMISPMPSGGKKVFISWRFAIHRVIDCMEGKGSDVIFAAQENWIEKWACQRSYGSVKLMRKNVQFPAHPHQASLIDLFLFQQPFWYFYQGLNAFSLTFYVL